MSPNKIALLPASTTRIEPLIHVIRGERIILDADLARIYGVPTKRLNEQVARNQERFPDDFMFKLTMQEVSAMDKSESNPAATQKDPDKRVLRLRSQIATSSSTHGGRRYLPYAFTEHGAIMAANVLSSKQAIEMSVFVVRAFVKMREMLGSRSEIHARLTDLERKTVGYDAQIHGIIETLRRLMAPPVVPKRRMGFQLEEQQSTKAKRK